MVTLNVGRMSALLRWHGAMITIQILVIILAAITGKIVQGLRMVIA